jgi:hypothetical protein
VTVSRYRLSVLCFVLLAAAGAGLTACGGADSNPGPPGSPDNPLRAKTAESSTSRSNEAAASPGKAEARPGYEKLVDGQKRHPRSRFTPCNLVTARQARAILGEPLREPTESPQGPTCIYRTRTGESFVTVALQSVDFKTLKPQLHLRHRVDVSSRTAYCGTYGQPMLYVPLSQGRVLMVAAQCSIAKQFALRAVRQLSG